MLNKYYKREKEKSVKREKEKSVKGEKKKKRNKTPYLVIFALKCIGVKYSESTIIIQ